MHKLGWLPPLRQRGAGPDAPPAIFSSSTASFGERAFGRKLNTSLQFVHLAWACH